MPIFDGNLPYTNLHELNLDWIIRKVRECENKVDEFQDIIDNIDQHIIDDIIARIRDGILSVNSKCLVYDTVAQMKTATDVQNGTIAITKGYYSINDGGGAIYSVVYDPNAVNNDMTVITLMNDYSATLLNNGYLNVLQLGFDNTGTTSQSTLLTTVNSLFDNVVLFFPMGRYLFSTPVTLNKHLSLIGEQNTYLGIDLNFRTVFDFSDMRANSTCLDITSNHVLVANIMFYSNSYTASADDTLIDGQTQAWYDGVTTTAGITGVYLRSYNNEIRNCAFRGFSTLGLHLGLNNKANNLYFTQCYTGARFRNDSVITDLMFKLCERGILLEGSLTTITNVRLDFIKTVCIILVTNSNSNYIRNVIADTVGERCIEFQSNCSDNDVECEGRVGYHYASVSGSTYATHPEYSCMVYIISNCVGNTIRTSCTQKSVNGIDSPQRTVVQTTPDHTHYIISGYKPITDNNQIMYTRYGYTATDSVLDYAYKL